MVDTVRIGGARVTFEADDANYQRVVSRVLGRQGQIRRSHLDGAAATRTATLANERLIASIGRYAGIAGVGALAGFARSAISAADDIAKVADSVGLSTDALQEYRFAASQAGIPTERFDRALRGAVSRIAEFRTRTSSELTQALRDFNPELLETLRNTEDFESALDAVFAALEGTADVIEQNAIAASFFGRRFGPQVINLVRGGAGAVSELREQFRELGLGIDEDLLRRGEQVTDQLDILERQVRDRFATGVLTVANNMDVLAAAATALGGVFGGRLVAGLTRSAQAFRANVREQRASLEIAEQLAARRARIAAEEARAVAAQPAVRGFGRLSQIEAQAVAQRRAAAAASAHAVAQRSLARATTLAGRAARAAGAALAFLGGPVGAIFTGISLAASAWLLFRDNAAEAGLAAQSVDQIVASVQSAGSNLTATGRALDELNDRYDAAVTRVRRLENALSEVPEGSSLYDAVTERLGDATDEANRLAAAIRDTIDAAGEQSKTAVAVDQVAARFERLALSLEVPERRARDLARQITDGAREQTRAAAEQIAALRDQSLAGEQARAVEAARLRVARERRTVERELRDLEADDVRARAQAELARERVQTLALGTDERKEAERQAAAAERTALDTAERARQLRRALEALVGLRVNEEAIARAVERQREARIAAALAEPTAVPPDTSAAVRSAADFTRALEEQVRLRAVAAERAREIAEAPAAIRPQLQAAFQILEAGEREQSRRRAELARATDAAADAERRYQAARQAVQAAGADATAEQVALLEATRAQAVAAAEQAAQAEAASDAFDGQVDAIGRLASRTAALTAAQRQVATGTLRVEDVVELATSGVRRFEDALVNLATGGSTSFGRFRDAILADLTRILTRVVITRNALIALGVGPGGDLQPGGFLARVLGAFAGSFGGAPPGVPPAVAHSGGIVGALPRFAGRPLRANERIVVTESGEEILTRRDPRHRYNLSGVLAALVARMPRYHDGGVVDGPRGALAGAGAGAMSVRVEIENRGSGPEQRVADASATTDLRGLVIGIALEDIDRNGPLGQAINLVARGPGG